MDNADWKRVIDAAEALARLFIAIRRVLGNLPDPVGITMHKEGDVVSRSADDLDAVLEVIADWEIPAVPGIMTIIRTVLLDWIVAADLTQLLRDHPSLRRLGTLEMLISRMTTAMQLMKALAPRLFIDDEE